MIPDYSCELFFPRSRRADVIAALDEHCVSDAEEGLSRRTHADTRDLSNVALTFRFESDECLAAFAAEYHEMQQGDSRVRLGSVYLWLSPLSELPGWSEEPVDRFMLWPCTRALQEAFFGSQTVRTVLVQLLEANEGLLGTIEDGSGAFQSFWSREAGRHGNDYPFEGAAGKRAAEDGLRSFD
jgi:hypothetical protein